MFVLCIHNQVNMMCEYTKIAAQYMTVEYKITCRDIYIYKYICVCVWLKYKNIKSCFP